MAIPGMGAMSSGWPIVGSPGIVTPGIASGAATSGAAKSTPAIVGAPAITADKWVTVEVVSAQLIRRAGALGLNRLSRGGAHREWDCWQDQPAGQAPWRHPATRDRVRQDGGHPTDRPETSRPQPCRPLSLWR